MNAPATTASAAIPFKPAEDTSLPTGSQWGLALVLCAVALGAALYLLHRRGGKAFIGWKLAGDNLLNLVESRALSPQVQLHVVRYRGRQLLLSVSNAGTQCLSDDPIEEGEGQP